MKLSIERFEEIYKLYSQELLNISYGYTKNKDDSFDIIQNVFYKLLNRDKDFKEKNNEKYWLIRVTINESKDFLRKKKKIAIVDSTTIDLLETETKENNEKIELLLTAIKKLPDKYKSVIILHYYDLLPIKEISIVLKVSESAVKKRLERARNMLKEEMEV